MKPLSLKVRRLEKRFGAVVALGEVDLDLEEGAALAVLGPNGAGKSTLLRILAGLLRPTGGEFSVQGHPQ
ncbi:MAG: ATP-binding cassette domain-containing protein, partial [Myxococcota bacterium]